MMIRRRRRPSYGGHAPAAPPEAKRKSERIPVRGDVFPWRAGELVVGVVRKTRGLSVLDRVRALYGPSETPPPP
jgi:hypothetical protein